MRACEERCLAGKCGWPLCGVSLSGCPGDDDARRLEGVGRGARAVRRTTKTPDGSAGSVRGGRGTYRIDAVRRKVYLRGDLDMFCGDAHRAEAEAVGVSLALPLDSETSEASAAQQERNAERGGGRDGRRRRRGRRRDAKREGEGDGRRQRQRQGCRFGKAAARGGGAARAGRLGSGAAGAFARRASRRRKRERGGRRGGGVRPAAGSVGGEAKSVRRKADVTKRRPSP